MYHILPYTKHQAKQLGVEVYPSKDATKKIDVYKNGTFVTSIGASGMLDYPQYLRTKGIEYAKERRRLYKIRHQKDRTKVGTAGFYADRLLW